MRSEISMNMTTSFRESMIVSLSTLRRRNASTICWNSQGKEYLLTYIENYSRKCVLNTSQSHQLRIPQNQRASLLEVRLLIAQRLHLHLRQASGQHLPGHQSSLQQPGPHQGQWSWRGRAGELRREEQAEEGRGHALGNRWDWGQQQDQVPLNWPVQQGRAREDHHQRQSLSVLQGSYLPEDLEGLWRQFPQRPISQYLRGTLLIT